MRKINLGIETLNSRWVPIFFLPFALFTIGYFAFGYYFGWLDDVMMEQHFRGLFTGEPNSEAFYYHRGLSHIYAFLYRLNSSFPWYGVAMCGYIFIATAGLFYAVSRIGGRIGISGWPPLALNAVLFFAVWFENVYLLTFTRVAILLMGLALVNIIIELFFAKPSTGQRLKRLAIFNCMFAVGYLTRPEMVVFPVALCALTVLLIAGIRRAGMKKAAIFLVPVISVFLLHQVAEKLFSSQDKMREDKMRPYVQNLFDGFNFSENTMQQMLENPADSIRFVAAGTWFYQDTAQIDRAFFQRLGTTSPFTTATLKNWKTNLLTEYKRARFAYSGYHERLNWFTKSVVYFSVSALLFFLAGFLSLRRRKYSRFFKHLLLFLSFPGIILLTAIFMKMEDRVFTPVAIIAILCQLSLFVFYHPGQLKTAFLQRLAVVSLLVVLLFVAIVRMPAYIDISNEKKMELKQKQALIDDLNTRFDGKIIMLDGFSRWLLHGTPFQNIHLDEKNQFFSWGEPATTEFSAYRDIATDLCGNWGFIDFYDCLCRQRTDVVFLFSTFRKTMLESYFKILYGREIEFKQSYPDSVLQPIRYSFLWTPFEFHYYQCNLKSPLIEN